MISKSKLKFPTQARGAGKGSRQHPLNRLIETKMDGRSKRQLAISMGVAAQTLYGWEREARENPRTFLVPAVRAKQMAEWFRVNPKVLRPDLF